MQTHHPTVVKLLKSVSKQQIELKTLKEALNPLWSSCILWLMPRYLRAPSRSPTAIPLFPSALEFRNEPLLEVTELTLPLNSSSDSSGVWRYNLLCSLLWNTETHWQFVNSFHTPLPAFPHSKIVKIISFCRSCHWRWRIESPLTTLQPRPTTKMWSYVVF